MRTVFLAGGIASGKSTVARMLEERGARRIDLDALSREVCLPGSEALQKIVQRFGEDVIDPKTSELRRGVLAQKAFATAESTRALEDITHPAIFDALEQRLAKAADDDVCIVEVPLLDRAQAFTAVADEILCVVCPRDIRLRRAVSRGMAAADFERRDAQQPSEEYLREHATTVLVNDGSTESLERCVDEWWSTMREEEAHA